MTDAILLVFFVHDKDRIHGLPAHEWLLAQAHTCGAGGGSVFRAVAGFGRHGRVREERFFDLAGDLALCVEFVLKPDMAQRLLQQVKAAGGAFPFMEVPCRSGTTDEV